MDKEEKVKGILRAAGYDIIGGVIPSAFTWQPDVLAKRQGMLFAFLIRDSDDIPEALVQRIAETKFKEVKTHIGIIFSDKPRATAIRLIKLYRIGIYYLFKNRLIPLRVPKAEVVAKKIVKIKKMPSIYIFVSSVQDMKERKIAIEEIKKLRDNYKYPLYPCLIEYERFPYSKLKKRIRQCLEEEAELFLGVLAEEYSSIVAFEIKLALINFDESDTIIFVKTLKKHSKYMATLIKTIESKKTVKHLPYSDANDFRGQVNIELVKTINKMYKEKNIQNPMGFS